MNKHTYWYLAKRGNELRAALLEGSSDDSALIATSYKLLNSIKSEEINQFIDIVYRLYNSTKKAVPSEILQILSNENDFKNMGQAFLLGFRGSFYEKEKEETI